MRRESLAFKEVLPHWREDVDEYNLFIHHGGAMPAVRWEMEHVARRSDALSSFDEETYLPTHDNRHLFVRVFMLGCDQKRGEAKTDNHQVLAHHHLSLDAFRYML